LNGTHDDFLSLNFSRQLFFAIPRLTSKTRVGYGRSPVIAADSFQNGAGSALHAGVAKSKLEAERSKTRAGDDQAEKIPWQKNSRDHRAEQRSPPSTAPMAIRGSGPSR